MRHHRGGRVGTAPRHDLLTSLREMPDALLEVLSRRDVIGEAARRFAPPKRYWAIVGSGPNTVAAEEVRIKLSELCYKSIACDVTEDKKHIDLSSEPLILVCAAGLVGGTADDVAKEVAIYKAHKATPIVVATEGDERFAAAAAVLSVPVVDSALAFVLTAMVGHLFGYEAALAIDASGRPLREAREVIEDALIESDNGDEECSCGAPGHQSATPNDSARACVRSLRRSSRSLHRRALSAMLADLRDELPLEAYHRGTGKVGNTWGDDRRPHRLAHPRHRRAHSASGRDQASGQDCHRGHHRNDEGVLDRALVQAAFAAGAGRDARATTR